MKIIDGTNLGYLISKIKAAFLNKTDVVAVQSLDIDSTPTQNSNNLVKSGGVHSALAGKQSVIDASHKLPYSLVSGTPPAVPTPASGDNGKVLGVTDASGTLGWVAQSDVSGKENTSNKVTSLSSSSTDTQYPSAKCVYDIVGDVETLINAL